MPEDFTPYWEQIVADIRARIASGQWPPGHRLPTHHQLWLQYREQIGARSNVHVRRAIEYLVGTGELRSHRGAGVWVADAKPKKEGSDAP